MKKILAAVLLVIFLAPSYLLGAGGVVINEIAWMGSKTSSNDEWLELANTSPSDIDITGWKLENKDKSIHITLKGSVVAGGFFLLERTDDSTVPGVTADQIYVGALSNSGEALTLSDAQGNAIDIVDASTGWPAGDNTTKNTMQKNAGVWLTAAPTPRQANATTPAPVPSPATSPAPSPAPSPTSPPSYATPYQTPYTTPYQTPSPSPSSVPPPASPPAYQTPYATPYPTPASLQPSPTPPPPTGASAPQQQVNPEPVKQVGPATYAHSIYISEFLPNPKGADEAAEWIELYNDADVQATIGGFFLDDGVGASAPYQIPVGTTIAPKGYALFNRAQTKIALNNTSDEVRLLYPDKGVAASLKYDGVKEGYAGAYDLQSHKLYWTAKPTPGQANILTTHVQLASAKTAGSTYQASDVSANKADGTAPSSDYKVVSTDEAQNQLAAPAPLQSQGSLPDFWLLAVALLVGAAGMFGYLKYFKNVKLLLVFALFLALPVFAHAETFNVASDLDVQGKTQVEANVVTSTPHSIVYLQQGVDAPAQALVDLDNEFETVMYPRLTAFLGEPWLGINNDPRITILFMKMSPGIGGYYDPENESPRSQYPNSNERKIIFLSVDYLSRYKIKEFLAHEFTHSITYNQKIRRLGKVEEVWLNELRSEYAPTYLGYDDHFLGSNLEERYKDFIRNPYDHLITWNETTADYGVVNMFAQYLVARFGPEFFSREIKSDDIGIASVNKTLQTFDPTLTFAKFFSQWRLTNYINDDSVVNGKYSYKNKNLPFSFAPELSMDISRTNTSQQTLAGSVPTFSAKAIIFHMSNVGSLLTFSSPDPSSDLVVTYAKEQKDGSTTDGQVTLESGSAQITTGSNTVALLALVSNASQTIINTTITANGQPITVRQPAITSIESVFVHPSIENNVFLIKGTDLDVNATLYINNQRQDVTFQDTQTLIARISTSDAMLAFKVVNSDGTQATFSMANPLQGQPSLVNANSLNAPATPLTNGTLVRAANDYRVYVINDGFRRHIIDARIFSFYPTLNPSAIVVVSQQQLDAYPESVVIRATGDQKIYEILANGSKRWIQSAQEYISRGFDWKAIFEVNANELNFYPTAS